MMFAVDHITCPLLNNSTPPYKAAHAKRLDIIREASFFTETFFEVMTISTEYDFLQ
jgi:hypothetical protein